ncbi:hypothetical protein WA158_002103 [Blastocystis sp. Blastoise]
MRCPVCDSDVEYFGFTPCCKTRACAMCLLNVVFYGNQKCPFCKRVMNGLVITEYDSDDYEDCKEHCFYHDEEKDIYYDDVDLYKKSEQLIEYRCPICAVNKKKKDFYYGQCFDSLLALREHIKKNHNKDICYLCFEYLRLFPFQQECYTVYELQKHLMSRSIEAIRNNETERIEHPICPICKSQFFNIKHLYNHMKSTHPFCSICSDGFSFYFDSIDKLHKHCQNNHYICCNLSCPNVYSYYKTKDEFQSHVKKFHNKQISNQFCETSYEPSPSVSSSRMPINSATTKVFLKKKNSNNLTISSSSSIMENTSSSSYISPVPSSNTKKALSNHNNTDKQAISSSSSSKPKQFKLINKQAQSQLSHFIKEHQIKDFNSISSLFVDGKVSTTIYANYIKKLFYEDDELLFQFLDYFPKENLEKCQELYDFFQYQQ